MKRAALLSISLILSLLAFPGSAETQVINKYHNAINVFRTSVVTQPYFEHSYGFAVFPTVGKAGFVLGGAYGKGKVFREGVMSGDSSLTQLSLGFQAGLQAYSEIVFFQDERAYLEFISGAFEFDATASAVAVTAGAQAQTGTMGASAGYSTGPNTDTQAVGLYYKGLAVFTHAKGGLMLEASVAGQKFNFRPQQFRAAAR